MKVITSVAFFLLSNFCFANLYLTTEYQEVEAEIRATSPRYAALTQPQPLSLAEIQQQVLDPDTLLLEYALGEERSYLWAVSPTSINSYQLPKRAEIEAAARRFHDLAKTETPNEAAAEAATALSNLLLSPVAAQLGSKRLVIIADGALQYVPFAALPAPATGRLSTGESHGSDGAMGREDSIRPVAQPPSRPIAPSPLIIEHEIVSLPSASTLAVLRREAVGRKPATKTVAVLADPVFADDDIRVKRAPARRRRMTCPRPARPARLKCHS